MFLKPRELVTKHKNLATAVMYGVTTMLQRGMGLILAVFNTHFMSQTDVGIYGIVISVAILFGIISDAGLSSAVLRTYYDHHQNEENARQYVSRLITGARLFAWGALVVILAVGGLFWNLLTSGEIALWPYLPITLAITFFMRQAQALAAISRAMEKRTIYFVGQTSLILVAVLGSALLVVVLKGGIIGALGAFLIAQAVSALLFSIMLVRYLGIRPTKPDFSELKTAVRYGLPLAFTQLATWGQNIALRVILVHLVSLAQVGVFFICSQLSQGFTMLAQAIEFAFVPRYFKSRVRGEDKAKERAYVLACLTLAFLTPAYVSLALFSREFLTILLPASYTEGTDVLAVLLVASFIQIQNLTLVRQFNFLKRTTMVPIFTTLPVILALAAVPPAVHFYGLTGAAWMIVLGNALSLLLGNILITRHETSDHPWSVSILMTGLLLIAAAATFEKSSLIERAGWPLAAYHTCRLVILLATLVISAIIVWRNKKALQQTLRS